MKILWIGGWAISVESMKLLVVSKFPIHTHVCIHPHKGFLDDITKCKADAIVGYSLGATLLIGASSLDIANTYLIAPFINIKNATHVDDRQIKYLLRWLKKEPIDAINDFYIRAKISHSEIISELPHSLDDLIWGIEMLIRSRELSNDNKDNNIFTVPKQIYLGLQDPLINPDFFLQNFSHLTTTISAGDHNLRCFLDSLPF